MRTHRLGFASLTRLLCIRSTSASLHDSSLLRVTPVTSSDDDEVQEAREHILTATDKGDIGPIQWRSWIMSSMSSNEQHTQIYPNDRKGRFRSIQLGDHVALNLSLLDQRARSLDPVDLTARLNHGKASCALLSVLWNHKKGTYILSTYIYIIINE